MMTRRTTFTSLIFVIFLALNAAAQSGKVSPKPTPPEDEPEKVFTEEIKLNVLAFDENGKFAEGVKKEDLIISENNVLHQASSLRRLPANVLIVMDTGGDLRQKKSLQLTRETAQAIVRSLDAQDSVAVMQYADKPEILAEWTTDRRQIADAIGKKSNFGRRDDFVGALKLAGDFLVKNPLDNKHLVLITDGTDSSATQIEKAAQMRNLLATDVNVHVISYTKMETTDIAPRTKMISNTPPPRAMPPEIAATLPNGVRDTATGAIGKVGPTINLDRALLKKLRERQQDLATSEKALSALSENTNGEFILPENRDEMIGKSALVAQMIDSGYVVTYVPKNALSDVQATEERNIEVTSRRAGLIVQAKRKLLVEPEKRR